MAAPYWRYNMKKITRSTSLLTAFVATAFLTGCGSTGIGDILGGGSSTPRTDDRRTDDRYDPYEQRVTDVRGTIESIDTRARAIVVDAEDTGYQNSLRNGNDNLVLYYDDSTTVEHQGRTYRVQDLERGDRIQAEIAEASDRDRLRVEEIQVLYDVTSNGTGTQNDDWNDRNDRNDRYDDRNDRNDDAYQTGDLRGTVRYIDTRARTLELDTSRYNSNFSTGTGSSSSTGRTGDVVVVYYDAQTTVEFEGRRYQIENLERGDVVEVDTRSSGGRLMAEEILVVSDGSAGR